MSKDHDADIAQRDRLLKLAALPDDNIDTSDIPEAPPGSWTDAEVGRFYRPRKEAVTIRLDADVLEWFRRSTPGGGGIRPRSMRRCAITLRRDGSGTNVPPR